MNIEKIDNNKLKISLSGMEILQLNLDIHPNESENSFLKLLQELENDYQLSVFNQKIILEMLPNENGDYSIYLTTALSKKKKLPQKKRLLIFSFRKFDMIHYSFELIQEKFHGTFSVYQLDECYYLVLYFEHLAQFQTIRTILSDLGEYITNPMLFESVLSEYAKPICHQESLNHFLNPEKNEFFSKK